jgi:hypothetical protein
MKVQLATLVLAEKSYLQFKLHLHDDLLQEILDDGRDPRITLRDNLYAHLKRRFGDVPWHFFVMEEHTTAGAPTRPHAHGSIEIRPAKLPCDPKKIALRFRRVIAKEGLAAAELKAGLELTRDALKSAGGMVGGRRRFAQTSGLDQCRNLWTAKPYGVLFNSEWVDYAFKNEKRISSSLSERRLVMPHDLTGEARRLWQLIKGGEDAMTQWDNL